MKKRTATSLTMQFVWMCRHARICQGHALTSCADACAIATTWNGHQKTNGAPNRNYNPLRWNCWRATTRMRPIPRKVEEQSSARGTHIISVREVQSPSTNWGNCERGSATTAYSLQQGGLNISGPSRELRCGAWGKSEARRTISMHHHQRIIVTMSITATAVPTMSKGTSSQSRTRLFGVLREQMQRK